MRGPIVCVTCHDPSVPGQPNDLEDRLRRAVVGAGLVRPHVPVEVTAADGTNGSVAVLELPVGELGLGPVDGSDAWDDLSAWLGRVLDAAGPALALGTFRPVVDLDQLVWRGDRTDWAGGRVQVDRLGPEQRRAFNELVDRRLVEVRDGAVRWAAPPGVPLGVGLIDVPPVIVAAATYEAYTGESADLTQPETAGLEEINAPVLWFGSADLEDLEGLAAAARATLPDHEVDIDLDYAPFGVVTARPAAVRTSDELVADLRSAVAAAGPSWAAVLLRGGILPPGVSPETPAASLVDHVWVDEAWAGESLPALSAALRDVEPERVGAGWLFATGDPYDRTADLVWTPMVRYRRLCRATRALGWRIHEGVVGPTIRI